MICLVMRGHCICMRVYVCVYVLWCVFARGFCFFFFGFNHYKKATFSTESKETAHDVEFLITFTFNISICKAKVSNDGIKLLQQTHIISL